MAGQLSHALADAGLVSREAVARQAAQHERKERKKQRKAFLLSDEGRPESYSSPAEFLEHVRKRLKADGYSATLMDVFFREAHQFADAKLSRKHRGRIHRFLCELKEVMEGASPNRRKSILRDGKRAFKQMNAKNL